MKTLRPFSKTRPVLEPFHNRERATTPLIDPATLVLFAPSL